MLDKYYLGVALRIAKESTCLWKRFGAIVVKGDFIISSGFNSAPSGKKNCLEIGNCARDIKDVQTGSRSELCRSVHAEVNAIIGLSFSKMEGATIYIAGFNADSGERCNSYPCQICSKIIKNSGIERVVY